jgi:hypothetical protein
MGSVQEGPRELSISTEQTQANGFLVTVRDTGPDIDPENIERVFEAFYTTKSSGVGMGLSLCRSIIAAHGGRLWADMKASRGAVFRFTLPGPRAMASARLLRHIAAPVPKYFCVSNCDGHRNRGPRRWAAPRRPMFYGMAASLASELTEGRYWSAAQCPPPASSSRSKCARLM